MDGKYKAAEINIKSWAEIEQFYIDLTSYSPWLQDIIPVIRYIKDANDLSQKLFACTSLDKLVVSIYNPIELSREAIHIKYNYETKLWNFKYHPYPYREVEHERNYHGKQLIEKFRNYIDMLKW